MKALNVKDKGTLITLYALHALQNAGCLEQRLSPKEGVVKWFYVKGGEKKLKKLLKQFKEGADDK